jgi:hypothetical protein
MIWMQKQKIKTPKYMQKIIIRRTFKKTVKIGPIIEDKSRHVIDKINQGFKSIIPKP